MENDGEPVAYFITWTVYGTFLQGDSRWWRKRNAGELPPQPLLEQWHRDRLKHEIILLNVQHLNTEDDLELAIMYAGEAQDRMGVEYVSPGQPLGDCFG